MNARVEGSNGMGWRWTECGRVGKIPDCARTASQLTDGITLQNATAWRDVYQFAVSTAKEGTA